jgi:uncharacterized protein YggE
MTVLKEVRMNKSTDNGAKALRRTITVKGEGKLELRPNLVSINITIECIDKDYKKSIRKVAKGVNELSSKLIALGFDESDIKTVDWDTEQEYEYRAVKGRRRSEKVFMGYRTKHILKIEFGVDEGRLPQTIAAVAGLSVTPEFSIQFTVKDQAAASDLVIADATKNACARARIIAELSGAKLGKPIMIDYNWGEYRFHSSTHVNIDMMRKCAREDDVHGYQAPNIEPENINIRDTITFVWEIE